MESIDRKFMFNAICVEHGHQHDQNDAMIFLAKDKALVPTLEFYKEQCWQFGSKPEQIVGIELLIARVKRYQENHPDKVKVADVDIPDTAGILDKNEPSGTQSSGD